MILNVFCFYLPRIIIIRENNNAIRKIIRTERVSPLPSQSLHVTNAHFSSLSLSHIDLYSMGYKSPLLPYGLYVNEKKSMQTATICVSPLDSMVEYYHHVNETMKYEVL